MSKFIFECCWKPEVEGHTCIYKVMVRASEESENIGHLIGAFLCTKSNYCEYQEEKEICEEVCK